MQLEHSRFQDSSQLFARSGFEPSKTFLRENKQASKFSMWETNMENFSRLNKRTQIEKIDPRGISAVSIYGSFSGVIEDAYLFSNTDQTFQISYAVHLGDQWHDETPTTDDTKGESHFCESKGGQATFSLGFDFLASCMYIKSWPKLVIEVKSFDKFGELATKGYAQINLPIESGQFVRKAYIYSILRKQVPWYMRWNPFAEPETATLDPKQIKRVILQGDGRQTQKIKAIGYINIRVETLLRNFDRFGYR